MDKIKLKALEILETVGKKVYGECDACLGALIIVVFVLFVTITALLAHGIGTGGIGEI